MDESEHEDQAEDGDEEDDEDDDEEDDDDDVRGIILSENLTAAPKPGGIVIDGAEEDEYVAGKKGKGKKQEPTPNTSTPEDRQRFFDSCRLPKALSDLSWTEKQQRLMRYELRLKFILESLQQSAKAFSWEEISSAGTQRAMNVVWWNFLMYISVQQVLPIILQAAPEAVSLVLGGPLTREELLLLPAKWEGVFLCGIYLDIVTGKAVQNGDLMEAYVGSATGEKGCDKPIVVFNHHLKIWTCQPHNRVKTMSPKTRDAVKSNTMASSRVAVPKPADGKCGRPGCDRPANRFNHHLKIWTCKHHTGARTMAVRKPRTKK